MSLFSFKSESVDQNVTSNSTLMNQVLFQNSIRCFQNQNNNFFSQLMRIFDFTVTQSFSQNQKSSSVYTSQKFLVLNSKIMSTISDSFYAFLAQFDTIFLINNSDSMTERSWHKTSAILITITLIYTQHDTDEIDIYFLNHHSALETEFRKTYKKLTRSVQIIEIFSSVISRNETLTEI